MLKNQTQLKMNSLELKEFRKKFNLTQSALAKMLGVDIKTIQNWESGKKIPATKDGIFRKLECELIASKTEAENVASGSVLQNSSNGDNFNGAGFTVHKSDADYIALLKKKDEQMDRLLTIIEKMQNEKSK